MVLTRKVIRVAVFLSVGFPIFASASVRPSVAVQIETATKGRDLILQRRYAEAERFLKDVTDRWPDELLGPFGLMALYQIRNLDNYDFRFDPAYLPWEARGRTMALKIAKDQVKDAPAWDMLLAGGTLGLSGFYRAHNSKWFAALRDASLGFHTVQKAYEKDKNLTESLLGVGLYNYWRSYFTRKLRFLPFFTDRREQGKEELRRAERESRFASVLADISLVFIDYQEKNYSKVLETVDKLLGRYPQNTILKMLKGEALLRMKRYPEAVREFEAILDVDPAVTKSYLFMGLAYAREGKDKAKAGEFLKKYLDLEPKAPKDWREPAIERLKELEKK